MKSLGEEPGDVEEGEMPLWPYWEMTNAQLLAEIRRRVKRDREFPQPGDEDGRALVSVGVRRGVIDGVIDGVIIQEGDSDGLEAD